LTPNAHFYLNPIFDEGPVTVSYDVGMAEMRVCSKKDVIHIWILLILLYTSQKEKPHSVFGLVGLLY
jgi:hypothetical protein